MALFRSFLRLVSSLSLLPANAQLSLGPCTLTEKFTSDEDGVVHAAFRFDSVKRRMTVAEATELRNKVAQLIAGEAILIYFEPIGQRWSIRESTRGATVLS